MEPAFPRYKHNPYLRTFLSLCVQANADLVKTLLRAVGHASLITCCCGIYNHDHSTLWGLCTQIGTAYA
jgi:hypothetical protein